MADKAVRVAFLADVQDFINGVDKASAKAGGFSGAMQKMALPAAAAFAAVTAAAVDFTKAAADDAKSAGILANALQNTTGATKDQISAVEDWISKTSVATATADDQLRPALAALARTTGDVSQAQDLLGIALNTAAATGKPVELVAQSLSKAYAGNLGALNKLVPGLVDTTDKSVTFADAMAALQEKTAGAAEVAANNDPYKKMGIAVDEAKEAIGAGLLPILQQLTPILVNVAGFIQDNASKISTLMIAIGALSGAILAINGALKVYEAVTLAVKAATAIWTVAQAALNIVLSANPIGLVVIAIGALVAALIYAYNNSETFRNIVNAVFLSLKTTVLAVFTVIRTTIETVWNWLKEYVVPFVETQIKANIAAFNLLKDVVVTVFDTIRNVVQTAWDFVGGVVRNIIDSVRRAVDAVKSLPGVGSLISGFRAAGGPVAAGNAYVVGEAGPEIFIPGRSGYILPNGVGGGGTQVNITVNGALDPVGVANQIQSLLTRNSVRLGLA